MWFGFWRGRLAPLLNFFSSMNYGFSMTAQRASDDGAEVFISWQAWERGAFRPILQMRPRYAIKEGETLDFVPVWETETHALGLVRRFEASPAGERFAFKAVSIRASIEAGGVESRKVGLFRAWRAGRCQNRGKKMKI